MKNVLLFICFLTAPVVVMAQEDTADLSAAQQQLPIENNEDAAVPTEIIVYTFPHISATRISHKKSKDLISITAYRRSLQIRTREIKNC